MHSSSNFKHLSLPLTISCVPTKSSPQFNPKIHLLKKPSSFLTISLTPTKPNPQICSKNPIFFSSSSRTKRLGLSSISCLIMEEASLDERLSVVDKVKCLSLEFRSLSEPIDRVKRLLHYASILPPLCESAKVQGNRVLGCTTQVWLEVRMDSRGSMKFTVDSDSEITKGFCSCLMWVLDGAEPEEILSVTAEDLADMNVGLPKKGRSRVNTWHNVLFSMQNRTQDCIQERKRALSLDDLHSLVIRPHAHSGGPSGDGSYVESEVPMCLELRQLLFNPNNSRSAIQYVLFGTASPL
ncbi:putative hepatoma-derived growth factor-related protein 2-like [Capsicum annuum]|uniref:sufE-like protein 2, chloroplastic isoform X1 n=2 Tax=Capsicum annuum TaxID=4072 RepID=UPI001FB0AB7D|nr:sufE-like protein 2, chloroplastic isoform X1 [Capsicum annuum]KAF3641862.1 putative hepatoma-derived growth factor-related protein 2-like [Capsicum annuum]